MAEASAALTETGSADEEEAAKAETTEVPVSRASARESRSAPVVRDSKPTSAPTPAAAPARNTPAAAPPSPNRPVLNRSNSTPSPASETAEEPVQVARNEPVLPPPPDFSEVMASEEQEESTAGEAYSSASDIEEPSADDQAPVPTTSEQDRRYELMRPEQTAPPRATAEPARSVVIQQGTILTVRTAETISTETHERGDTFMATLDAPLVVDDLVIAERGARVEGRIVDLVESGRVKGVANMTVALARINTSDGQTVEIETQPFTVEAEKSAGKDAAKVGIASGIGAALGAIFGGGRGAAIGAAAGAGAGTGTVLLTKGKAATIDAETRINFRIERDIQLTEKLSRN